MSIDFSCSCGKTLHAPDGSQGKRAKCTRCGTILKIPADGALEAGAAEYELTPAPQDRTPQVVPVDASSISSLVPARRVLTSPVPTPTLTSTYVTPPKATWRRFSYLLLFLALIPLALSTFLPSESQADEFFQAMLDHPELVAQAEKSDMSLTEFKKEIFETLPGHHVTGALLPYESHAHWLMAAVAAAGYFAFLLVMFPQATRFTKGLLFAGLFTGTAGIIVLLVFQFAAFSMPMIIPRGIIGLVLLVVKLIGMSYKLADDPDMGFLPSFLGYTCGVGLCEEITKAIPLLFRIKPTPGEEEPTWNSLLLWGLASGMGFGIAEGIMYSGRYYNGLAGADMYWTRFVSCVVLHAMWSGAVGISVYRQQGDLINSENNWVYFFRVILIVLVPMILHGLYDTLLKKEHDVMALVVGLATFGWLAYQIERQQKVEPERGTTGQLGLGP